MQTQRQNEKPWDKFGATYYWHINLDPRHQRNTTNILTGYSKKAGESENQDKAVLLRRKIVNLFLNSYFKKMLSIEFFMRMEFVIDKKRDPKILILYPTHYDICELNHDIIHKLHGRWLLEFYDCIKRGEDVKRLLPTNAKPPDDRSKDEFLNIHRKNLMNVGQLYTYAGSLLAHGHPEGSVNDFIHKYKSLKGW